MESVPTVLIQYLKGTGTFSKTGYYLTNFEFLKFQTYLDIKEAPSK